MAQVKFYEVEGKRHPAADVNEVTERRCDACGEFLAPTEGLAGQVQVTVYGGNVVGARFDAHPEHTDQALADAMRTASERVQWPPSF